MTRAQGRWFDLAFALACVMALVFWLAMGSGQTFMIDEWRFIMGADDWSLDELMRPLNGHWSLGVTLVWRSLMATVGLSSYMPYLLVVNLLHIAVAAGIYTYARRQTLPVIALGAGVVFLFLGSGFTDLVLGMQINFNLAAAAGVWALVILLREPRPRHAWLAAVLLVVAVATNGVGLAFVAAAMAIVVISRRRWRWWWVPVPAIVAFGLWYLAYGREDAKPLPGPIHLVDYVVAGVGDAFGQVTGFSATVGLVIAALVLVAALANVVMAGRLRLGLVAGVIGLIALYTIIGLARAETQPNSFGAMRFVDVAAVFCLIAIIGLVGHRRLARGREAYRVALVVVALVVVSLTWNMTRAFNQDVKWQERADYSRAAFTLLEEFGGSEALPADRGFGYLSSWIVTPVADGQNAWLPSPDRYAELVEQYGSPLGDPLAPWGTDVPDEAVDDLFSQVIGQALVVGPGDPAGESLSLELGMAQNVITSAVGECEILEATGPQQWVELDVPSGAQLSVMSDADGAGSLAFSLRGTYPGKPVPLSLTAGETVLVDLPDIGVDETMALRLAPPAGGLTLVCLRSGDG